MAKKGSPKSPLQSATGGARRGARRSASGGIIPNPLAGIDWEALGAFLAGPPPEEVYYDEGGGYDSGGGGGGYAPPPAYDPNSDPSYLALLAQLGLEEQRIRNQATESVTRAKTDAAIAAPRIQEQGVETRRGINNNWEGRGLYRSGARLRDLAIQERGQTQRLADLERGTANRISGIGSELASGLAELAQKRTEAAFQASLRAAGG